MIFGKCSVVYECVTINKRDPINIYQNAIKNLEWSI